MAQGQSAYKSHLPLLNALKRVPVTDWSADFSQAWALGKETHPNSWNVPTPLTWNMLMAYSLMQALQCSPERSDAHTHVCALWMQDGSSLRPGLMAELNTPTRAKDSPHRNRKSRTWAVERLWTPSSLYVSMIKVLLICAKAWACPHIVLHRAELLRRPALAVRLSHEPSPREAPPAQHSPVVDSLCTHSVKPKKWTQLG